jgi:hypothetical protein
MGSIRLRLKNITWLTSLPTFEHPAVGELVANPDKSQLVPERTQIVVGLITSPLLNERSYLQIPGWIGIVSVVDAMKNI